MLLSAPMLLKGGAKHLLKEGAEVLPEVGSRGIAISKAKNHASVPSPRKGGETIPLDKVKESSRGKNWNKMKENGATSIGARMKDGKGKNKWFDNPDVVILMRENQEFPNITDRNMSIQLIPKDKK